MDSEIPNSLDELVQNLPYSRMIYPESLRDKLKYVFWRFYTPYHPIVRDTALKIGIVEHRGRQDFLLGRVAPHLSIEEFITLAVSRGFGNHFVAWHDDDQVVSLRYLENFKYQYHLRVFKDGEVRGHYEYTPECYPIAHYYEVDMEHRPDDFFEMMGDWIV